MQHDGPMQAEDRIRLQHMLDACYEAQSFIAGHDEVELKANRLLLLAIVKSIEIIGEAASRVSQELRNGTPQIPWRQIVAMRNRLIHGYFDINTTLVWKTVNDEIPLLIKPLEELLR
jgi:uncharacterized protein with HEPN domain